MSTSWHIVMFIALVASLSFVAALLLSLPSLFSRDVLRRRRHLPSPPTDVAESQPAQFRDPVGWRAHLSRIVALPYGLLLIIVIFPAVFALAFVAICVSYRFYRHLAYRALRRHRHLLAFPLSFSVGFRMLIARMRQPYPATPQ